MGRPEKAREYLEESLATTRRLGLRRDLIYTLINLSALLTKLGEFDEAEMMLTESNHHAREMQLPVLEAAGTAIQVEIELNRSHLANAARLINQTIDLVRPEDNPRQYAEIGVLTAELVAQKGDFIAAAAILGKSLQFAREIDFRFEPHQLSQIETLNMRIAERIHDSQAEGAKAELWTTEEFVRHLRKAARRAGAYSAGMVVKIPEKPTEATTEFTNREREILQLLYAGESTRSMADLLSVSPRTVTTHIGNMMTKMGVSSRAELIAKTLVN